MDYQKVYNDLVSFRKSNPLERSETVYTEEHHIIPKCIGGDDSSENLILLTAREHFIAHRLLSKIYPGNTGLARAVILMLMFQNRKICSREYDRLKEMSSEGLKQRWKDPEFREMMSAACSKSQTERWKDPEFREMMADVNSKRSKQRWANPEFREMMAVVNSKVAKQLWIDPTFREMVSSRIKQQWENPEYRANRMESLSDWYKERRGQPWLMRSPTKEIWSLAQLFWERRPNSPNASEIYSIRKFCIIFNEGKNLGVFESMNRLFKGGWIPNEDTNWLKEFGHIRF